jgi:acetate kinase
MSDTVLVLNSGSSSIKFGLFDISAAEPTLLCKGLLDEHETKPRLVVKSPAGEDLFEKRGKHRMRTAIICSPTCSASSRIASATIACALSAIASSMAVQTIPLRSS